MRTKVVVAAFLLSGCSMGYWPKVEGDSGARYQADVRECQTATHKAGAADLLNVVAFGAAVGLTLSGANQSKSDEGRDAIDTCMAQRGYRVSKME